MILSEGPNIWINAKLITIMHYGLLMVTNIFEHFVDYKLLQYNNQYAKLAT